jgi:hypothetical protein
VVLVQNPDPAFLNFPGCVICAFPSKGFRDLFERRIDRHKIYESAFSPETEDYNKDYEYVPVILNDRLLPNSALPDGGWGKDRLAIRYKRRRGTYPGQRKTNR